MKAIIPVAGAGTMLRPLTYTQPKPLIPVAGKPIVSYIIEELEKLGITEMIFVVGYLSDKIKDFISLNHPQLNATFVHQSERKGLGHAVWMCKDFVGQDELVIFLGDTIVVGDLAAIIKSPFNALATKKVGDPTKFGVVELDSEGFVTRAVEKPTIPKSNNAIVGLYKFKQTEALFRALEENIHEGKTTHGEVQLTDAIMRMVKMGHRFIPYTVKHWFDCGRKEILLEANAILLDRGNFPTNKVEQMKDTILIPPVSIGKNCRLEGSIIGPHVTIGSHSHISSSIVKESIIGNYSRLNGVNLHNSIVGNDASIKGMSQSLNIGDNTEIDLS